MTIELSAILISPYGIENLRQTLDHLARQTVASRIELVLCLPPDASSHTEPILQEFADYQILVFEGRDTGAVRARAVQMARASVVATCEDHSFPEPTWAEALLRRHQGSWAAVGYNVLNGNPESGVSWVLFFMYFGAYTGWEQSREMSSLAQHQTSYKRDILMQFEGRLGHLLGNEKLLFEELTKRGYCLYLEADARVHHIQWTGLAMAWRSSFHSARQYASGRSRNWGRWRKFFYSVLVLGLPAKSFLRVLGQVTRARQIDKLPLMAIPLLASLIGEMVGEMAGYLTGAGDSARVVFDKEFCRPTGWGQ